MARPTHDTSTILDAAGRILGEGGPAKVTMAAVIREAGVPSGSLYYRFPDRPALLAALWNGAIESYHRDAYPLFEGDPVEAAAALAAYTVRWCQAEPAHAHALLAGRARFEAEAWPEAARDTEATESARWNDAIRGLTRRVRAETSVSTTELLLVVVDLPYAAVRRYLSAGKPIPADLADVVAGIVRTSLR
ncbi:TetR/AcrR family transcriptional regulator [Promicromonospora sp. NPDC050262]|uniref:TetR/AcrR family transcriptional regulator n=1 Tax=Promicromonospora sp. NPDC050262 TaxID=3155036 RepID=UPI003410ED8B